MTNFPKADWESADGSVRLYRGDCRNILPAFATAAGDLLLADPPYGRGKADRFGTRASACAAMPYTPIFGDDEPFDPSHLLRFRQTILWGANWYADKLPASNGWIIWDKKDGGSSDNFGDAEMAWTNFGGSVKMFVHKWRGMIKASERGEKRVHPTQKPVRLMQWCMDCYADNPRRVIDPYMGSGTAGVAAVLTGRQYVGMEIADEHFSSAVKRISDAIAQPRLFATEEMRPVQRQEALVL